ncbi:Dehydrogenase mpl7 [Hyphodiscus hymeniophilus]|uniref:Dehydrogenase mpl7 n=1 Tax=Hyphodiscus hymeniophilus TaxID=353542 RepID=A0A9P6VEK3_9HELO|nr:Dehydrogenase mpl7 [Hyphodiscus hymeniophilus]
MAEVSQLPALCSLEEFLEQKYDFVIVGGGTAGLVVAARLTENPNVTVGVLEAGPANIGDPMIMMPVMYTKIIGDPKYDWLHKTVPQKSANDLEYDQPRGRCLGGSSAINYQMYVRGHKLDYDDWAKLGNKGWGYDDLLPYFRKHEQFDDPAGYSTVSNIPLETKYNTNFHGKDGPIHTSFSTWRLPLEKEWIAASSTLGNKIGSPVNAWDGDHLGTFHSLSTIDRSKGDMNGTRSYAVTGYLLPSAKRPNLKVLTEALVSKLVVSEGGEVTGVEFLHSGVSHIVQVMKEVVLSAGVVCSPLLRSRSTLVLTIAQIKSPQVLELSGIGNPSILSKSGIKCLVDNPRVGEGFNDHSTTGFGYEVVEGEKTLDMLQNDADIQAAMTAYMTDKSGPFSSGGAAMGFVSYADLATPSEVAALQKSILSDNDTGHDAATKKLVAQSIADHTYGSLQFILIPATINMDRFDSQVAMFQPPAHQLGKQGFMLVTCIGRPLSRGSIHITSSDPQADPAIDPGYLTHPADIEVLSKGLQMIEKVVSTSPMKEKIKRRYHPETIDTGDKKSLEAYIRKAITTEYHPIGSVAMGKKGVGAVDDRLKVWGTKGLRVIDASVMPLHISGNIIATVYAIAEKGSDMIKEDWGL